jgi:hypothetical protein
MTDGEGSREAWLRMILGAILAAPAVIALLFVFLKLAVYKMFIAGSPEIALGETSARMIRKLLLLLYDQVPFTPQVWQLTPTPSADRLFMINNLLFLLIYIVLCAGFTFFWSGHRVRQQVKRARGDMGRGRMPDSTRRDELCSTKARLPTPEVHPAANSFLSTVRSTWLVQITIGMVITGTLYMLS